MARDKAETATFLTRVGNRDRAPRAIPIKYRGAARQPPKAVLWMSRLSVGTASKRRPVDPACTLRRFWFTSQFGSQVAVRVLRI
jgi:hypothetical protein